MAQGKEEVIILQAMDNIPETEALVMRKVLLKLAKEVGEPP